MIDWTRVEELRDEIGAEDFDEVVKLFLGEVEERIETAMANDGTAEIESDLHFLKGSALNLGFSQFAQSCSEGENRAANGAPIEDFRQITEVYQSSKKEFLDRLSRERAA